MTVQLSRRNILKSTALLLPLVLFRLQLLLLKQLRSRPNGDETTDIIIVGSGFAGLSAAVGASNTGAKVIVLEKMPTIGGNSVINAGDMCAVGTPQQAAKTLKTLRNCSLRICSETVFFLNDPKKVKFVAEHANDNYKWLVDEIGVEFMPVVGFTGGHSVPAL